MSHVGLKFKIMWLQHKTIRHNKMTIITVLHFLVLIFNYVGVYMSASSARIPIFQPGKDERYTVSWTKLGKIIHRARNLEINNYAGKFLIFREVMKKVEVIVSKFS